MTLRGKPAAVVVSAEEYERLAGQKPSLGEFLLQGEPWDDGFLEEVDRRNKWTARDIDL